MLNAVIGRLRREPRESNGVIGARSTQAGQSAVLIALAMLGMLSMLSLAVDTGNLYLQRRRAQQAADMAALAGAANWTGLIPNVEVKKPDAFQDARRVAIANGFDTNPSATDDKHGEVTVFSPPETATGLHNDVDYIEVRTTRTVPALFGRILGFEDFTVNGHAVARVKHIAFDAATISLSEDDQSTKFQGNADIQVIGNVYSRGGLKNLSASTKVTVEGDVFVRGTVDGGTLIETVGGETITGTDNVPYLENPGYLPPPKPSAVINTWKNNFSPPPGQSWVYITPGQYQSIDVLSSGTPTVFCTGVYWVTKTVSFSGIAKTLPNGAKTEDGLTDCEGPVVFVLDGSNARFEILASGEVNFHSDTYYNGIHLNNILIYSATYTDPSTGTVLSTGSCGNPVKINAGTIDTELKGTIYLPCGDAQIAGNGTGTVKGQMIANTVTFLGGSGPSVTYNANLAPETPGPTLVE